MNEKYDAAQRNADLASLALDAGRMGLFDWRLDTNLVVGDATHAELFGTLANDPYDASLVFDAIHPEDRDDVQAEIKAAFEGTADYDTTFRTIVNGQTRWLGGRGRVVERGPDGSPARMMGVNWDRTADEQREVAIEALAREMNHRVNNAFAVIEALLAIGGRSARSVPQFAETLRAQVHALADTHRLMVGETLHDHGPAVEVPMGDIVQTALREWIIGEEDQIALSIDPLYVVPPNRIAGMAMLLHELSTNSRRYGVLGPIEGKLSVSVETGDTHSRLTWREHFDPERNPAPPRHDLRSFGEALLHHCRDVLNAVIDHNERDAEGFLFVLHLPIVHDDEDRPRTHAPADPAQRTGQIGTRP